MGHPSIPLTVTGATADSEQSGEEIWKSHDGDYTTFYHANWGDSRPNGTFELVYTLEGSPTAVMVAYYPRPNIGNGSFGNVEIQISTTSAPTTFVSVGNYTCNKSTPLTPTYMEVEPVANTHSVKFIVDGSTSKGGFASCAEMEFFGIE